MLHTHQKGFGVHLPPAFIHRCQIITFSDVHIFVSVSFGVQHPTINYQRDAIDVKETVDLALCLHPIAAKLKPDAFHWPASCLVKVQNKTPVLEGTTEPFWLTWVIFWAPSSELSLCFCQVSFLRIHLHVAYRTHLKENMYRVCPWMDICNR